MAEKTIGGRNQKREIYRNGRKQRCERGRKRSPMILPQLLREAEEKGREYNMESEKGNKNGCGRGWEKARERCP